MTANDFVSIDHLLAEITSTVNDYSTGNQITNNTTFVDPSNPYVANSWLFRGLKK